MSKWYYILLIILMSSCSNKLDKKSFIAWNSTLAEQKLAIKNWEIFTKYIPFEMEYIKGNKENLLDSMYIKKTKLPFQFRIKIKNLKPSPKKVMRGDIHEKGYQEVLQAKPKIIIQTDKNISPIFSLTEIQNDDSEFYQLYISFLKQEVSKTDILIIQTKDSTELKIPFNKIFPQTIKTLKI